jgi:hypothetical protein
VLQITSYMKEPIYVLDKSTKEILIVKKDAQAIADKLGIKRQRVYNLTYVPTSKQLGEVTQEYGRVLITRDHPRGKKILPELDYIVTDGTLVYHKGTQDECKQMRHQLGFSTLKVMIWKQQVE